MHTSKFTTVLRIYVGACGVLAFLFSVAVSNGCAFARLFILSVPVCVHRYSLKFQNRRPEYINSFWNVVNWDKVGANFNSACAGNTALFDVPLAA